MARFYKTSSTLKPFSFFQGMLEKYFATPNTFKQWFFGNEQITDNRYPRSPKDVGINKKGRQQYLYVVKSVMDVFKSRPEYVKYDADIRANVKPAKANTEPTSSVLSTMSSLHKRYAALGMSYEKFRSVLQGANLPSIRIGKSVGYDLNVVNAHIVATFGADWNTRAERIKLHKFPITMNGKLVGHYGTIVDAATERGITIKKPEKWVMDNLTDAAKVNGFPFTNYSKLFDMEKVYAVLDAQKPATPAKDASPARDATLAKDATPARDATSTTQPTPPTDMSREDLVRSLSDLVFSGAQVSVNITFGKPNA